MTLSLTDRTLQVGRYNLAPLALGDAGDLLRLFADPDVVAYMDIDPLTHISQATDIVEWAKELAGQGRGLRWSIRRSGDRRLIGTVGFNLLELDRGRRGEIAYDLERAAWGQGVMSEILPKVMAFGYGPLGLHRLEAMVTVGNARSCGLLEKHGFEREGLLRDHAFWKGRFWDQLIYGRLAD